MKLPIQRRRFLGIVLLVLFGGLVLVELFRSWDLLRPQGFFAHHQNYRQFRIYADAPITKLHLDWFDDVESRLSQVPIYRPEQCYTVFLCHKPKVYGHFAQKIGKPSRTQGFHLQPIGYTFISLETIERIKVQNTRWFQGNLLEGSPVHSIAHEITHGLLAGHLGYFQARQGASWKLEGYCEFAASGEMGTFVNPDTLSASVRAYLQGRYAMQPEGRRAYIRAQLLMRYLLGVQKKSLEEIMDLQGSETELWATLLGALSEDQVSN